MFNIFSSSNGIDISSKEFKEKLEKDRGVVIDVRTRGEFEDGHLAITDQQLDLTNGEFQQAVPNLDPDKTYYLYCRSGNRSGQAARMMKQAGFENVFNVGGFDTLVAHGFEAND
ncbi:rhodanese-like domain-containing protein [Cyclonatronum proteinivorum]|nr:rhodanese-like domain-containing protein [Cyclonatronum proteinivorum]